MLRARCTEDCGCVQFELAEGFNLLAEALRLDERVIVVERQLVRTRAFLASALGETALDPEAVEVVRENERLRGILSQIAGQPTSSRAEVQSMVLLALGI